MRDARYLRAQAELCLEMARQVSDRATAVNLRAEAARYHAEAAEIETGGKTWEPKESPEQIADIRTTRTAVSDQVADGQPAIVIAMRPEYPHIRFQHPKGSIVAG